MHTYNKTYILGITLVSAMGGFLFGYDWVVIGGAKPFYERFFDIVPYANLQAWAMSSALLGCIVGALFSGIISTKFGRKIPLIISGSLFLLGSLGTGLAHFYILFIVFRILGGIGIGLASAISPIYIAEVAPSHLRGRLVSVNQLTIVIGILTAQIINMLIAEKVPGGASDEFIRLSWNGQIGWRWMFYACAIPSGIFLFLLMFLPESPRWLLKMGNPEKAFPIFKRIGGAEYAIGQSKLIGDSVNNIHGKSDFKNTLQPKYRKVLMVGLVIAVFQQWSGINIVFNYAEEIFASAGYGVSDTLFNIVITGSVNLVFTFIAMLTVDKWGRKKLMLMGSIGLVVTYIFLGFTYFFGIHGSLTLFFIILGIGIYAMTLAPITWVILSEIFPNKIRGTAMAIATLSLWIACFILTYTFPILNKGLGVSGTFWIYACICMAGFFFILKKLPETKNKTLEEIEELI